MADIVLNDDLDVLGLNEDDGLHDDGLNWLSTITDNDLKGPTVLSYLDECIERVDQELKKKENQYSGDVIILSRFTEEETYVYIRNELGRKFYDFVQQSLRNNNIQDDIYFGDFQIVVQVADHRKQCDNMKLLRIPKAELNWKIYADLHRQQIGQIEDNIVLHRVHEGREYRLLFGEPNVVGDNEELEEFNLRTSGTWPGDNVLLFGLILTEDDTTKDYLEIPYDCYRKISHFLSFPMQKSNLVELILVDQSKVKVFQGEGTHPQDFTYQLTGWSKFCRQHRFKIGDHIVFHKSRGYKNMIRISKCSAKF